MYSVQLQFNCRRDIVLLLVPLYSIEIVDAWSQMEYCDSAFGAIINFPTILLVDAFPAL